MWIRNKLDAIVKLEDFASVFVTPKREVAGWTSYEGNMNEYIIISEYRSTEEARQALSKIYSAIEQGLPCVTI